MKKKVLLTGGSGLLAVNWAVLINKFFFVTSILHERIISIPNIQTCVTPLDSLKECLSIFENINPDIVIHTAAITNIEKCENDPLLAKKINVDLAKNIAIACNELNIKLVHISTDHLFSGLHSMSSEESTPSPQNIYACTKHDAEVQVQENCSDALIIRTNFYGWGTSYRSSFSDFIICSLRARKMITLYSNVFYSPILIESLVFAVHELLDINKDGIFNIGGGDRISKYEFGYKIAETFSLDADLIKAGSLTEKINSVIRPLDMSLSNDKICKVLKREVGFIDNDIIKLKKTEIFKGDSIIC